jgi:serine phosphatase RsbU (regulator of sigma subunit)
MAMKEAESCNDKKTLLEVYSQSENIYFNTQDYEKTKQILLKEQKTDPSLKQDAQHNADFGDIFRNLNMLDSADYYYLKAIKMAGDQKDSMALTGLYFNYILIPLERKEYKKALEYCKKGLEIAEKIKFNTQHGYFKLYSVYRESGDYVNAKRYLDLTIKFDEERNCIPCLINKYRMMSELSFEEKEYKEAYSFLLKSNDLYFEQNNSETRANLTKVEEDNLKKQKQLEIDLINQQKESEKRVKNISFIALTISLTLILGIIFSLVKINKSKKLITLQQIETEKQKHLVEEKQKEIVDSISYAKRLQEAILPPQEFVNKYLAQNFIYYQPKDIVAGDFYWAEKVEDLFFIAAADSTGHGVPGAMVSVVCSNALNRAIKEFKLTETGKILDKTRDLVIETFEKSASEVKDGMDISLLCIDIKNKNIFWSGANNPLWYIQANELKEIKADKQPIGKTDYSKPFTTHQIEFKENTSFYLFTDGFADQFGGPNGKKFKYKPFSELLLKSNNLSQAQQAEIINKAFTVWKGDLEQVDDVCVIGIKV